MNKMAINPIKLMGTNFAFNFVVSFFFYNFVC